MAEMVPQKWELYFDKQEAEAAAEAMHTESVAHARRSAESSASATSLFEQKELERKAREREAAAAREKQAALTSEVLSESRRAELQLEHAQALEKALAGERQVELAC